MATTKSTKKATANQAVKTTGLILSVVSAHADALWVVNDPNEFVMHAFVKGDTFVQYSHKNMEMYLKAAGLKAGTLIPTSVPVPCVVVKAWPSRAAKAGLRPCKLADVEAYINKEIVCSNADLNISIQEEKPTVAHFAKQRIYDAAGAWVRLDATRQELELDDFKAPMAQGSNLYTSILAGEPFQEIDEYLLADLVGTPHKNVLMHGVPSAGKTTICQAWAAKEGLPYAMLAMHDMIEMTDMGAYIVSNPKDGQINFEQKFTKFLMVYISGGVCVIDEGDAATIGVQKGMNNALYGDCHLTVMGRDFYRHPDTVVFITCNTGLAGDQPFLNALETRLRPFLIPALTLEQRVSYWHKELNGEVTETYLEAYVHLCDALQIGLNSEAIAEDDDRHPDGTAFNSRGHLTMLTEWLRAKDRIAMTPFVRKYMMHYIGNIPNAADHLNSLMDSVADKIAALESLAPVAFIAQADTDEGIDDAQFANIMAHLNSVVAQNETVEIVSADEKVTYTFKGGRYGAESVVEYSNTAMALTPVSGNAVADPAVAEAAYAVVADLMERGIFEGIHDLNPDAPVLEEVTDESEDRPFSMQDVATAFANLG